LMGLMQSYIIQFKRSPPAGTDRCPPRQPTFCVAEPLQLMIYLSSWRYWQCHKKNLEINDTCLLW
jgi:hypothetical protein